jgi:hypothetical protein
LRIAAIPVIGNLLWRADDRPGMNNGQLEAVVGGQVPGPLFGQQLVELVRMLWHPEGDRRGDVQRVVAPARRLGPALVGVQGGLGQVEPAARRCDRRTQVRDVGLFEVPDRAAHVVPARKEVADAVPSHEPCGPGDQHPGALVVIHAQHMGTDRQRCQMSIHSPTDDGIASA